MSKTRFRGRSRFHIRDLSLMILSSLWFRNSSFSGQFPNINILKPKVVPVVLQLDLAGQKDGLAAIPVIFQDRMVHDQFPIQENLDLVSDHDDAESIPM